MDESPSPRYQSKLVDESSHTLLVRSADDCLRPLSNVTFVDFHCQQHVFNTYHVETHETLRLSSEHASYVVDDLTSMNTFCVD